MYWRHAHGDQYKAIDILIKVRELFPLLTNQKMVKETHEIYDFQGDGVALGMYNTDESIRGFAHSCFNVALNKKWPLYLSTKKQFLSSTTEDLKIFSKRFMSKIKKEI